MERSTYYKLAIVIGATVLTGSAFSKASRDKIHSRDVVCVNCGSSEHLECAHIDHSRSNPKYDDTSNGRLLCSTDHLKDHINRHGRNGLNKSQNEWAIKSLLKRIIYKAED